MWERGKAVETDDTYDQVLKNVAIGTGIFLFMCYSICCSAGTKKIFVYPGKIEYNNLDTVN